MSRPDWIDRERALLRRLREVVSERARREADLARVAEEKRQAIEQRHLAEMQAAEAAYDSAIRRLTQETDAERESNDRQQVETRANLELTRQTRTDQAQHTYQELRGVNDRDHQVARQRIEGEFAQTRERLEGESATAILRTQQEFATARESIDQARRAAADRASKRKDLVSFFQQHAALCQLQKNLESLSQQHAALCERDGWYLPEEVECEERPFASDSPAAVAKLLDTARKALQRARSFPPINRRFKIAYTLLVLVSLVLLGVPALNDELRFFPCVIIAAFPIISFSMWLVWRDLERQVNDCSTEVVCCCQEGERMLTAFLDRLNVKHEQSLREIREEPERETREIEEQLQQQVDAERRRTEKIVSVRDTGISRAKQERDRRLSQPEAEHKARNEQAAGDCELLMDQIKRDHDSRVQQHNSEHEQRSCACAAALETQCQLAVQTRQQTEDESRARYQTDLLETDAWHQKERQALFSWWSDELTPLHAAAAAISAEVRAVFPDWSGEFAPRDLAQLPEALAIGRLSVDLALLPDGLSADDLFRLRDREALPLPALVGFPDRCSLLLTASSANLSQAVVHLRATVLRIFTALPPGKVRFTFIDTVALGQHFAPFLRLGDHDESLVSGRVWTEQRQIEQQLDTLAENMTNVIQKYLRGEFPTITDYNIRAGEVAEPYRFLVVAGFPVAFSAEALRRLLSIITAGQPCGINTLLLVDRSHKLPAGFDLESLRRHFICFDGPLEEGRFVWQGEDFSSWPLQLDTPPPIGVFNTILDNIGARAPKGGNVRVPFESIAPERSEWWAADSRAELCVPLGRAGAVRLLELRLGRGVAQHVLIAGQPGSGKSTLLHTLIVNTALHYSPEQVQLYLVDFKKGVEFKPYATDKLPHARVIAIESEREFGLSVLQCLDAELKARGNDYRKVGAQDLSSYRKATEGKSEARSPRILLIVDEFQEFFVEDDHVARDARLLLDRLVRQGRAFGIHVILGSQTLAGTYTLAQATLGQMAVRVALQCNDADGRLILGNDNNGARLLSRPGQAVYNDANGAEASNNVFQTAYLDDEQRGKYLQDVRQLAAERKVGPSQLVVFEGNVAQEVGLNNRPLYDLLNAPGASPAPRATKVWLGEPVAIADSLAAVLERQSGTNLLVVGGTDADALSMAIVALVSLAAQHVRPETGARIYLVNGLPYEEQHQPLLELVGRIVTRAFGRRDAAACVAEVAAELDQRIAAGGETGPPLFLLLLGTQHLRDLRRSDEGGFARGAPAGPAQQFSHILREGPGLGVFTLVWSDTLVTAQRCLDRQGLRDFALRVAFQMNVSDSTTLIDSPAASKLGPYAALYYNEQLGHIDKFRPYGLPEHNWLAWAVWQLTAHR